MADTASSDFVFLKRVRAQWLDIFKPGEGMNGGAPKYKVVALMEPGSDNYKACATAMVQAAKGVWGENAVAVIQSIPPNNKAVRNGNNKLADDGSIRPEFKDLFFISSGNQSKPQVIGPKRFKGKNNEFVSAKEPNGPFVQISEAGRGMIGAVDVTDDVGYEIKKPYKGCYINMKVVFFAAKAKNIKKDGKETPLPNQVYAKIEAVQWCDDGEAFGAGPTSAEGFGEEEVAETPVASTNGADLF